MNTAVQSQITEIVRRSRSNLAFALACLPRERREDMHTFYAFCRVVDDLADDEDIPLIDRREGLERWRRIVVDGGAPDLSRFEEAVVALRDHYRIPSLEMQEIIDGVSMDLEPMRFPDWAALELYCYRVACCVGLVSIRIFGCRMPRSHDYAVELGHALQLTNILRDIRGDWQNGRRLYLPQDVMASAGYTEADIAGTRYNDAFFSMMRVMIDRAHQHYAAARAAITPEDSLPLLAPETMHRIYSETLSLLEIDGCRVYDIRYSLPKLRKARLVATSWVHGLAGRFFS